MMETIALLTGADPGIGFETGRQLAEQGDLVLLSGHNATSGWAYRGFLPPG